MHLPESSNRAAVQAELDVSKARSMSEGIVGTCGSTPQALEI